MRNQSHSVRRLLIIASMAVMLTLAACGAGNADATPTMSVDEIYTAAFHTLAAQRATQLALTPPTSTPSKTPQPTVAPPTLPGTVGVGTAPATTGVQSCNSSVFINDVTIPDGTVMVPGQTFTKTWALMNKGTCAWSTSYKLVFIGGEAMGGTSVPLPGAVPSGAQTAISVSLTAPATPGDYTGTWQLQTDTGQSFGVQVTVVIKVSGGSGSTNTPGAATATQAATAITTPPTP